MSTHKEPNLLNQKIIFDITKFTTTDFADHLSCIVWFAKCNMRCLYCYNEHIVYAKEGNYSMRELLNFLVNRRGLLDAVVLSGGESTLNNLELLCKKIKSLKYKIKIDTNGLNPTLLKVLIDKKLVDFISLDYKAPQYKFEEVTQCSSYIRFEQSLSLLVKSKIDYEVRTTVHNDLLNSYDINFMISHLEKVGYKKPFYIQHYLHTPHNIGNIKKSKNNFNKEKIVAKNLEIIYRNEVTLT